LRGGKRREEREKKGKGKKIERESFLPPRKRVSQPPQFKSSFFPREINPGSIKGI
jgi:hypothetical protein